jgi:hypothetical protein
MAQAATALEPRRQDSPASTNLRIIFGSKGKLDELSRKVVEDFRSDIFRLAGSNLANATGANVDNLCNAWTQAQERYKNRAAALTTFKTELTNTIDFFIRDHSQELLMELRQLVAKCDEELNQRSQVSESIVNQKAIFEEWIAEVEAYKTKKSVGASKTGTSYKNASKKTTKRNSNRKQQ